MVREKETNSKQKDKKTTKSLLIVIRILIASILLFFVFFVIDALTQTSKEFEGIIVHNEWKYVNGNNIKTNFGTVILTSPNELKFDSICFVLPSGENQYTPGNSIKFKQYRGGITKLLYSTKINE